MLVFLLQRCIILSLHGRAWLRCFNSLFLVNSSLHDWYDCVVCCFIVWRGTIVWEGWDGFGQTLCDLNVFFSFSFALTHCECKISKRHNWTSDHEIHWMKFWCVPWNVNAPVFYACVVTGISQTSNYPKREERPSLHRLQEFVQIVTARTNLIDGFKKQVDFVTSIPPYTIAPKKVNPSLDLEVTRSSTHDSDASLWQDFMVIPNIKPLPSHTKNWRDLWDGEEVGSSTAKRWCGCRRQSRPC